SLPYIRATQPLAPYRVRPIGYSYFLAVLAAFHSVWLVTAVQAVMGLAMGVAVYAVLRRDRVPQWAAAPAGGPGLLLGHARQMEIFVLSDTLFGLLVTLAVVLMLWRPVPSVPMCALVGLVLAWAILDREQGILLPIAFGVYLVTQLVKRVPAARVLASIAAMG